MGPASRSIRSRRILKSSPRLLCPLQTVQWSGTHWIGVIEWELQVSGGSFDQAVTCFHDVMPNNIEFKLALLSYRTIMLTLSFLFRYNSYYPTPKPASLGSCSLTKSASYISPLSVSICTRAGRLDLDNWNCRASASSRSSGLHQVGFRLASM